MRKHASLVGLLLFVLSGCSSAPDPAPASDATARARFGETIAAQTFFKGALHAHSDRSDGDSSPEKVAQWYRSHGFDFLALTDHDKLTRVPGPKLKSFITIGGVELTGQAKGGAPVHVNALCASAPLRGVKLEAATPTVLQQQIDLSRKAGAVTLINHPNLNWAITQQDLLAVDHFELLEIASGSPESKDTGDSSHASVEELWDNFMTTKHRIFAAAVDDAHHFKSSGDKASGPGRAWVSVWAAELTEKAICEALKQGHFYSSRGARLTNLLVNGPLLELAVDKWNPAADYVDFIGAGGKLLARTKQMPARYSLQGGEGYVRAHVVQQPDDATRREAWTQAYFVKYK